MMVGYSFGNVSAGQKRRIWTQIVSFLAMGRYRSRQLIKKTDNYLGTFSIIPYI